MKRSTVFLLVFAAMYLAAAILCLRQWDGANPWARLDLFSGGYLLISLVWLAQQQQFHGIVFQSKEMLNEAAGAGYDPGMIRGVTVLSLAELAVFCDYGHWRLTPWLAQPALQWLGLALSVAGVMWMHWVDGYLTRHFSGGLENRAVMTGGPYRWVRHPRYLALLVSRAAFALCLASGLAWFFVLLWVGLVLRRIRREEAHMRELFGDAYARYSAHTARLLPGVY